MYNTGTLGAVKQTIPYTYGDDNWKDMLTAYNGTALTYDAIGNPLNDGTWSYTWGAGRQLRKMSKSGMTVEYAYDHNGLRTQKKVTQGSTVTTTDYQLHGKLITHMKQGSNELHFFYDGNSRPAMVKYNGALYTYVHNLQGDIVAILDSNGTKVVEYVYDAWGKPLSTTGSAAGSLGKLNPFRYRGYVYDTETGLYYLRSRYYHPVLCRFYSADVELEGGLLSTNCYCYCTNSPCCKSDPNGKSWISSLLHGGNALLLKIGIHTAAIGAFLLGMTKDTNAKGNVYHADFNCWQQHFGYNNLYDWAFNLGTSMKSNKFEFTYNSSEYVIWMWKGDYINLGAGAEIGIYTGGEPHWKVDKSLAMNMSMNLSYKGESIATWTDRHWWLTSFCPDYQNVSASDLSVTFTITFDDGEFYQAFKDSTDEWSFDDNTATATYIH